jgi:hypothetical protein
VKYASHFTGQAEIAEMKISWPDFLSGKNQAKQSAPVGAFEPGLWCV